MASNDEASLPHQIHPELDRRLDAQRFPIPCGCFAWKFGSASGARPCSWHAMLHLNKDGSFNASCDCIICQASSANASPVDWVCKLMDQQLEAMDVLRSVREKCPDRGPDGQLFMETRPCGCILWRKNGERKKQPCDGHRGTPGPSIHLAP